jgi:hypothetical protein
MMEVVIIERPLSKYPQRDNTQEEEKVKRTKESVVEM